LLIANFLAGERDCLSINSSDNDDIKATKRCLLELSKAKSEVVLPCGESGSTLRFLSPLAAALGKKAKFKKEGRLASRPNKEYSELKSGVYELEGNVSSQFVTGLLFALPVIDGDSEIKFLSLLQSEGYVNMTLDVLSKAGIIVKKTEDGFFIKGNQRYKVQETSVEGDCSAAAFWHAANALGNDISISGVPQCTHQPDKIAKTLMENLPDVVDVSQCPDIFPALCIASAGRAKETRFTGIARLRIKESDRVAAMRDVLGAFGIESHVDENSFTVFGTDGKFKGGKFNSYSDHRIAMTIAIGATRAESSVFIDNALCAAKSYPKFFAEFSQLEFLEDNKSRRLALSIGSNIEPREKYLESAVSRLASIKDVDFVGASSVIETDPVDVPEKYSSRKFLNQAVLLRSDLPAQELSEKIHSIEADLGRVRIEKNGPRTIDIDLISYDGVECETEELTLPHPRARERDFVTIPLAELGVYLY
jgi:3-phosphoshikimate 1-carboxyvinyltransferase